jgi:putative transposase
MGARAFDFVPGEFFHIYNRGNSKQKIFLDHYDHRRFATLLFVSNSTESFKLHFLKEPYQFDRKEKLVSIGAYCLMPNHFHILITPLVENGISTFMKKVTTGYSMYFNNKYERTGSLFEGRFKAQLVSDDIHLKYLYAYIHLNPVKIIDSEWKERGVRDIRKVKSFLDTYQYSSYKDFVGEKRIERGILDPTPFPEYFQDSKDFQRNIFDWFELSEEK